MHYCPDTHTQTLGAAKTLSKLSNIFIFCVNHYEYAKHIKNCSVKINITDCHLIKTKLPILLDQWNKKLNRINIVSIYQCKSSRMMQSIHVSRLSVGKHEIFTSWCSSRLRNATYHLSWLFYLYIMYTKFNNNKCN